MLKLNNTFLLTMVDLKSRNVRDILKAELVSILEQKYSDTPVVIFPDNLGNSLTWVLLGDIVSLQKVYARSVDYEFYGQEKDDKALEEDYIAKGWSIVEYSR